MNLKSKGLGFAAVFFLGFFLLGRVAFSEDDHAGHDHGPNIPALKHENKAESDQEGHDHQTHDSDEAHDHAGHDDHDDTDEGPEADPDERDHDDHDKNPSASSVDTDHEGHDHGDEVKSEDDGHGHGKDEHDGALELTDAQKREINLTLEQAGPGSLHSEFSLMGEIRLNEDRVAHVVPKMSGVVRDVGASLGDEVNVEQILASIESAELAESKADYLEKLRQFEIAGKAYKRKKYLHKEKIASEASWLEKEADYLNAETALKTARSMLVVSGLTKEEIKNLPEATDLQFGRYELRAPMSGTIIEKHITVGEKLSDDSEVFTISDLSLLWVDLKIPARDIYRVKQGSNVVIESSNGIKAIGTISLIGPVVDEVTRTALARLMLENEDRRWKPGTFVTGFVRISAEDLSVVVSAEAVQNMEGKDVIFVQEGDAFKPVPVVVGRRDRTKAEIISGLKPGTFHVTQGAFELKAMMITSSLGSHAGHGH